MLEVDISDVKNVNFWHKKCVNPSWGFHLFNPVEQWNKPLDMLRSIGKDGSENSWYPMKENVSKDCNWISTSIQWNRPWGNSWSSHFSNRLQHVQFQVNIQSPYYMATWCDMAIPWPSVAGIACSKTLGPEFPQFQARSLALTVKPHSISSPTDQAVPDLGLMRMAEKFGYFYPFWSCLLYKWDDFQN